MYTLGLELVMSVGFLPSARPAVIFLAVERYRSVTGTSTDWGMRVNTLLTDSRMA